MKASRFHTLYFLAMLSKCTYDSTPPGADRLKDDKPAVLLTLTGFTALKQVFISGVDKNGAFQYLNGGTIITDVSGRFITTIAMTNGTRAYTLQINVDESGDGLLSTGATPPDLKSAVQSGSFTADTDIVNLQLKKSDFTGF